MKKLLLTLIVAFAFCGSTFAQYQSYWPGFYDPDYAEHGDLVTAIMIDGQIVDLDYEGWDALEIAPFVGDVFRGSENYLLDGITEYGDTYLMTEAMPIFYNNQNEVVSFKMYDHMHDVLYENCEVLYMGEVITIVTGEDHFEGWDDPDNPVFLNFLTPQTYTKDIAGFGGGDLNWYLISSPIGTANPTNVENMLSNEYDLYAFDQTQNLEEWQNYKLSNFIMESGKGYLYANEEDITLSFTGIPYHGNGEVTLVKDNNANLSGWNLVGNPFGETAYIDRSFYVMNETRSGIIAATTDAIEPMQGIFVIAEEDGETLTFTTTAPNKSGNLALNLNQNNNVVDRAIVNFDGERSLPKFQLFENNTKLYIPMEGKDYAVVSSEGVGEMPVNFKAEKSGSYSLSLSTDEVSFAYLHLIDNMTGNDVDMLANPSYSFNAQATDYASRFRLVFATGNSVDGDNFGFFNSNGNFCIYGIEGEATLQVVDMLGHIMSSETFSGSYEKNFDVATGVYMVRLINGNDVKVQKIVVK